MVRHASLISASHSDIVNFQHSPDKLVCNVVLRCDSSCTYIRYSVFMQRTFFSFRDQFQAICLEECGVEHQSLSFILTSCKAWAVMRNFLPISEKRSLALLASKFEGFLELLAIRRKPNSKKIIKNTT